MSEEYLSGFCPRCGEALTVPAKLSEFSCMFCGARLSADELLDTPAGPAVSLAPDEAALRFDTAKKQLPSCVRCFRGYQKKATKNEFEAAFSDVYQAAEPVFRALDEAVSAMPGSPDARLLEGAAALLDELELESPDMPFGLGSGAAIIYGTSGGVAEAVVRHCLPDKSKNALREISILGLRGDAPIKEASVTIGDTELKLAVVNGLANAKKLLKEIDEGKKFYHLIEVMTCQGGCVGGAGQPYGLKKSKEKRGDGLHLSDNAAMFKRAERNPVVAQMMAEYGEERCHELLHVTYTNK